MRPSAGLVPGYEAALLRGWSPNTLRDVSAEQAAAIRALGPERYVAELLDPEKPVRGPDGRAYRRLPSLTFWIFESCEGRPEPAAFCGVVTLRFQPGTDALPDHVPGHVGYAVVPWKRRRGHATRAMGWILEVARREGLRTVVLWCAPENLASRRVIETSGGEVMPGPTGDGSLSYRIVLAR